MFFLKRMFKQQRHQSNRQLTKGTAASEVVCEAPPKVDYQSKLLWFREQLSDCSDVVYHEISLPGDVPCALIYIMNMIDKKLVQEQVIAPLLSDLGELTGSELFHRIAGMKQLPVTYLEPVAVGNKALDALFGGSLLMLIADEAEVISFPMRSVEKRAIESTENENVIRGPKEAFVEDLHTNLTMIRRRIKHPALKTEKFQMGTYSNTTVVLCYVEGICKSELVDEIKTRMQRIDIDHLQGSSQIEEFIEDNPFSPFPQVQYTERPDTVAASLMEGRVAILVDGTPMPILVPVTLYMLLQSAEDYYQRFVASTWIRWIRFLFLLVSFLLPSFYIAVTTFHPEMLPPNLLVTVAAARESVPFPAIIEAFIMELTFEALREAGLRIPKPIGYTVSIIGALVIGQAAVQAGIVSAPMVIVVSITGIASFIIPHFDLSLTFRLLRFPVMFMAASFGLYGIILSILLIYTHLTTLRSFGTPYLTPTAPIRFSDWKDVLVRAPYWLMKKRPLLYGTENSVRMGPRRRPILPQEDEGD